MPFVILLLLPKILISSSDARIWFFDLIGGLSWPMQYSFQSAPILSPDIYRFVEQLRSIKPVQVVYQQQELYFDVIAIISYWLTTINGSTINLARVSHELSEKEVLLKPLINSKSATMDTSLIFIFNCTGFCHRRSWETAQSLVSITWLRIGVILKILWYIYHNILNISHGWGWGRQVRADWAPRQVMLVEIVVKVPHLWWDVLARSDIE